MTRSNRTRVLPLILLLCVGGCSESAAPPSTSPTDPVAPSTASPSISGTIDAQIAEVGAPFSFDAAAAGVRFTDPAGGGLTISIALEGAQTGLRTSGTRIEGVPTDAGIVTATVTARDVRGRTAELRVPVIVQRNDLTAPTLPSAPYPYADASAPFPHHVVNSPQVQMTDNTPSDNRITDAGAALGRVLFYDRRLSANDQVSCATCHQQAFSFSDTLQRSVGFRGALTARHSMALTNTRFYRPAKFFRDERASSLESLVLQPVSDPIEMGLPVDLLVPKLRAAKFYGPLFAAAFGDSAITLNRSAKAMAQFIRALQSTNSRLDSTIGGGVAFTPLEQRGSQLFDLSGCRGCHESYVAVSDSARNNGLDATNPDAGSGGGRFKAPSLRNVVVRPPYMHDGRFKTLDAVIDFYDHGIENNANLDRTLRAADGSPRRFNFSSNDKAALIAFLRTLTDTGFLTDRRFADPFAPTAR